MSNYGKTKIYSEAPVAAANPEHVLVVPGYSETLTHNEQLLHELATRNFGAFTFSPPRRTGGVEEVIDRQGDIVLAVIDDELPAGEKVHAVGHSLGTAALLKAAQVSPERFASLTLMQPVGYADEQSFPEQTARTGKKVVRNQWRSARRQDPSQRDKHGYTARADKESAPRFTKRVTQAQVASSGVLARNPRLALKEAKAAGRYDATEDIARVLDLRIPVNVVIAHSDEMFDYDKVLAGHEPADRGLSISTVADQKAGHDTFWMQPARTASVIDQIIHGKHTKPTNNSSPA